MFLMHMFLIASLYCTSGEDLKYLSFNWSLVKHLQQQQQKDKQESTS